MLTHAPTRPCLLSATVNHAVRRDDGAATAVRRACTMTRPRRVPIPLSGAKAVSAGIAPVLRTSLPVAKPRRGGRGCGHAHGDGRPAGVVEHVLRCDTRRIPPPATSTAGRKGTAPQTRQRPPAMRDATPDGAACGSAPAVTSGRGRRGPGRTVPADRLRAHPCAPFARHNTRCFVPCQATRRKKIAMKFLTGFQKEHLRFSNNR
jgi:hypothetical protein